eukprot:7984875-Prorocentrum_lima.AAC.1
MENHIKFLRVRQSCCTWETTNNRRFLVATSMLDRVFFFGLNLLIELLSFVDSPIKVACIVHDPPQDEGRTANV